jgi:hypothetical protein
MIISGTSMEDVLASMLTNRSNVQVQNQISMALLKQQQDMQEDQAAALIKMINDTSLDGTGQIVNRTA